MNTSYKTKILKHLNIPEESLLGQGGESLVYKFDDENILRIYKQDNGFKIEGTERLKSFYDSLQKGKTKFLTPMIGKIDNHLGAYYSIEPMIHGKSLTDYLKNDISKDRLQEALTSYVESASNVHKIGYADGGYFGEVLTGNPIRTNNWSDFLISRAEKTLKNSYRDLQTDVENLDDIIQQWKTDVQKLHDVKKDLVHGDFFPSNVIVDDEGKIKAVIDFSSLTVLGDWRMDIVGAYIFLEVTETYKKEQTEVLGKIIKTKFGDEINQDLINLYRTYYSLYFSFVQSHDSTLYNWCVDNLNKVNIK